MAIFVMAVALAISILNCVFFWGEVWLGGGVVPLLEVLKFGCDIYSRVSFVRLACFFGDGSYTLGLWFE